MPDRDGRTIYYLGTHIQWLLEQDKLFSVVKGTKGIRQSLEYLLDFLKDIGFEEKWVIDEIKNWIKRLTIYKTDQKIAKDKAKILSYDADTWNTEIEKFLDMSRYYEILPGGTLDTDYLLYEPTNFFTGQKYWRKLSKIAKRDFKEACRCIAFELPTPSAFLVMRCTEEILRKYYDTKMGKKITGFLNWSNITKELRSKKKVTDDLADDLDYLRNNFRNPVSHPEALYSQKEAERLIHIATRIIEKIIDQI